MERVEEIIRDYYAQNLDLIESGLQIIKKEYPLPNNFGSKGNIDILAQDKDNNFTIIEIKRSVTASRQALHELFKYPALLKQNYHCKDSEIRLILISSEWRELLVPYSEFIETISIRTDGFKITLDESYIPINISPVVYCSQVVRH